MNNFSDYIFQEENKGINHQRIKDIETEFSQKEIKYLGEVIGRFKKNPGLLKDLEKAVQKKVISIYTLAEEHKTFCGKFSLPSEKWVEDISVKYFGITIKMIESDFLGEVVNVPHSDPGKKKSVVKGKMGFHKGNSMHKSFYYHVMLFGWLLGAMFENEVLRRSFLYLHLIRIWNGRLSKFFSPKNSSKFMCDDDVARYVENYLFHGRTILKKKNTNQYMGHLITTLESKYKDQVLNNPTNNPKGLLILLKEGWSRINQNVREVLAPKYYDAHSKGLKEGSFDSEINTKKNEEGDVRDYETSYTSLTSAIGHMVEKYKDENAMANGDNKRPYKFIGNPKNMAQISSYIDRNGISKKNLELFDKYIDSSEYEITNGEILTKILLYGKIDTDEKVAKLDKVKIVDILVSKNKDQYIKSMRLQLDLILTKILRNIEEDTKNKSNNIHFDNISSSSQSKMRKLYLMMLLFKFQKIIAGISHIESAF
jgi:hypothetical protein